MRFPTGADDAHERCMPCPHDPDPPSGRSSGGGARRFAVRNPHAPWRPPPRRPAPRPHFRQAAPRARAPRAHGPSSRFHGRRRAATGARPTAFCAMEATDVVRLRPPRLFPPSGQSHALSPARTPRARAYVGVTNVTPTYARPGFARTRRADACRGKGRGCSRAARRRATPSPRPTGRRRTARRRAIQARQAADEAIPAHGAARGIASPPTVPASAPLRAAAAWR